MLPPLAPPHPRRGLGPASGRDALVPPLCPESDNGPGIIKTIANATRHGVGDEKYALGFKGGWPHCANASEPDSCVFDEVAKETVRYVREALGVKHAARWCDAPRSQAEWDAWGYFLHGDTTV